MKVDPRGMTKPLLHSGKNWWLLFMAYWFRTKSELWPFRISRPEFPYQQQLPLTLLLFHLSVVSDSLDPMDYSLQALLSVRFSRQKHWSGLPFPFPGNLPNPGIKPTSLISCIGGRVFCHWATGSHLAPSYSHRAEAALPLGQCAWVMGSPHLSQAHAISLGVI